MSPAAALAALALAAGDPGFEASVSAAAGWDSNLSHSSSTSLAVGAGYGAVRAGGGASLDLGETTSLYAGLRLEGETYPALADLSTASAGVEAALTLDLSEAVALVLAPSAAGSWSGDAARNASRSAEPFGAAFWAAVHRVRSLRALRSGGFASSRSPKTRGSALRTWASRASILATASGGTSKRASPSSIFPGGCGMSRRSESAVTLFPHPVSPTRPSVSPSARSKSTPSSAFTTPAYV